MEGRNMKHLKKDCPLTVEMIAKQRQKFLNEARVIFSFLSAKEKQDLVAARTILLMDKFRYQETIEKYLPVSIEEELE